MRRNASYLDKQTCVLVYAGMAYRYLFEPVLEHMAATKVATSTSKDLQFVMVLV